jgi:hypothetical protein
MKQRGHWVPRVPYKFSHRAGDTYYWRRRATGFGSSYEEVISCNVDWFWGKR